MNKSTAHKLDTEKIVKDILGTIERQREQDIIARRFGLFDRKETLEQIGDFLGLTRERVRQLEKAIVVRLKIAAEKDLPHIKDVENTFKSTLAKMGNVARVHHLTEKLTEECDRLDQARVAFLGNLSPAFALVDEDEHHYQGVGLIEHHDEDGIRSHIQEIVSHVKEIGQPADSQAIHERLGKLNPDHIHSLASLSKKLTSLNNVWGLIKWPTVNPKNIRDKIFLILRDDGQPMHFGDISKKIKASAFKRKDVTTQAIHNELIKDRRFILIGRGIYALKEWGYNTGTVADVITEVLKDAGKPMTRDQIVKQVLETRMVKETTVILNLQSKPQFKRVAKATYDLDISALDKK